MHHGKQRKVHDWLINIHYDCDCCKSIRSIIQGNYKCVASNVFHMFLMILHVENTGCNTLVVPLDNRRWWRHSRRLSPWSAASLGPQRTAASTLCVNSRRRLAPPMCLSTVDDRANFVTAPSSPPTFRRHLKPLDMITHRHIDRHTRVPVAGVLLFYYFVRRISWWRSVFIGISVRSPCALMWIGLYCCFRQFVVSVRLSADSVLSIRSQPRR